MLHCRNAYGQILALAADEHYRVIPPQGRAGSGVSEVWAPVSQASPAPGGVCRNSFTGKYLQVLPDDRDTYNELSHESLSFKMTGLEFAFKVDAPGVHTAFLRWTGGDTVGGGDSMYVTVWDATSGKLMPGLSTFKPSTEDILDTQGKYAGCCYNPVTHQCPCFESAEVANHTQGPLGCVMPNGAWQSIEGIMDQSMQASSHRRVQQFRCETGHGELSLVHSPMWYLFAGQAYGNVMDFDSEPWDSTYVVRSGGHRHRRHTGLNLPQWDLPKGEYHFRIYPREDGTAFDTLAILTPGAEAPNGVRMGLGGSTMCPAAISTSKSLGFSDSDVVIILLAITTVAYGVYVLVRRKGGKAQSGLSVRSNGPRRDYTTHLAPHRQAAD